MKNKIQFLYDCQKIFKKYSIEGNQIVLSFQFNGEFPDGRFPFNDNGERPSFNNENQSRPSSDIERLPFNGQSPPVARSLTYSFNKDNTIL